MAPLIVGIAGGSGSGKSTVARRIAEALAPASVAFIDMDAYYRNRTDLTLDQRRALNWDHPDAFDLDLFIAQLDALHRGEAIQKPVYDFVAHLREPEPAPIAPADVVIVDGILLFNDPRLRDALDIKVFVDTDSDERFIRRLKRDMKKRGRPVEEIIGQYLTTVQPMHRQFVEPSRQHADIILPRGAHNQEGIDAAVALIRRRLNGASA